MYDLLRESEWYYFTPITRKYVNSSRPNRVAPNGFWKPRMNNPIKDRNNEVVGYRTSLEFYEGKYPNGNKTGWKMNEYTINEAIIPPNINTNGKTRIKLDDCVLCKIFTLKVARKLQNEIQYQLENPIGRNKATSTSIVGPSNTTTTTGDQLPVHDAMEHEPHSNHEVQQDGSSDSKHEEDDDGWLIIGVESLNISSDPMIG
ncbi:NAC domain-containing protein 19 [Rosa chinensis]|uniref:NAC domain-containing protein 19 n=1 Tax=Rosa chinensis TaxID=74649 RepID=UPI000D090167|nr:NAC domain-containing protein 19 [Rosa chinensis]